jgi:hypothetical protein
LCADGPLPTGSGISAEPPEGLSSGAKIGIAVGAVAVCATVAGAAVFLFCTKRKRRKRGSSGGRKSSGGHSSEKRSSRKKRRRWPRRGGDTSDMTSDTVSQAPGPLRGLTHDYFGPVAVTGPFTEIENGNSGSNLLGRDRAVPAAPLGPDDIAAPVEIGDGEVREKMDQVVRIEPRDTIHGRIELDGSEMLPTPPAQEPTSPYFESLEPTPP